MPSPSPRRSRNGKPSIAVRRPPQAPDPAEVERFVAGAQASGRPDVQAPPLDRPGLVQRATGRVRRRRTVYLPPELDRRLAVHCAAEGLEVSDVVAQAVSSYLPGEPAPSTS